nr:ribosomal protein S11 [Ipomoea trifida]GLL25506.1 ribosomal protein S11 [Ipomoea trifida]
MAKAIPRRSSRRNGRIGSRKSARRIPKGVIHVQASFNNTIVTVTDVRGRVVSWSSAGTSGFKGTRRGTPFAAETAASNAIRTVVDRGMLRAEVMIKGPGLGRDAALRAILQSGQADTIGIAMRRALLGEIEGTCITRVKSEKAPHEYSTIAGELLLEMKEALKLRERIAEIYAQRTGNPTSIISRDMDRDVFFSARQARIYGIIDDIEFSDDEEFLRG